jgi:chemotaxis protein MotB
VRRKKRHEEHVNHERWLVSYADFITLLFAFFVVLYSSSQVDKRKVGRLALAIQVAFQELGVFESSNTKVPLTDPDAMPFEQVQIVENINRTQDMQRVVQPMHGMLANAAPPASLKDIQAELEKALAPEIRQHVVVLKARREGLVISLQEVGFYESGSADLRPSSEGAIDRLAAVLRNRSEDLRIEGHTDNVPIHNLRFASNWELSTARATNIIRLFIDHYHFQSGRLAAAGYSEHHPVDSNSSVEGRARNRRVDIVVLTPPAIPMFDKTEAQQPAASPAAAPDKVPLATPQTQNSSMRE